MSTHQKKSDKNQYFEPVQPLILDLILEQEQDHLIVLKIELH